MGPQAAPNPGARVRAFVATGRLTALNESPQR
jgi:hypothetical protein